MLPSLSQLHPATIYARSSKPSGIRKPHKPKSPRGVVMEMLFRKKPAPNANRGLGVLGLEKPCLIPNNEHNAGGFQTVITQQEARDAFKYAERLSVEEQGKNGEARKGVMRGHDVIIKQHLKPLFSKENAVLEEKMHRLAWLRMKERAPDCASLLSIPACMDFEESANFEEGVDNKFIGERHAFWYTVQSYVSERGYSAPMSFQKWLEANKTELSSASREVKEKIARAYGRMLACLNCTGIIHNDLHGKNLLVLQCDTDAVANSCGSAPDAIVFRVIDWGLAEEYPPWRDRMGTPVLCAYHDEREKAKLDVPARQVGYFSSHNTKSDHPECRAEFAETLVDLRKALQDDPSPEDQDSTTPDGQGSMEQSATKAVGVLEIFGWLYNAITSSGGGQSHTATTESDVTTWVREAYAQGMRRGRDQYARVWEDWSAYAASTKYDEQW